MKHINRYGYLMLITGFALLSSSARTFGQSGSIPLLGEEVLRKLRTGEVKEVTVEFRKGDQLPLTFRMAGELVESVKPAVSEVTIRRGFYIRATAASYLISFDGEHFRPFHEAVGGELSAGASAAEGSQVANAAEIEMKLAPRS